MWNTVQRKITTGVLHPHQYVTKIMKIYDMLMDMVQVSRNRGLSNLIPIYNGETIHWRMGRIGAIKLFEHDTKVLERIPYRKLAEKVSIDEMHYGFYSDGGTTDKLFIHSTTSARDISGEKEDAVLWIFGRGEDIR